MAEIITSIGTNTSIATATPTSCSGSGGSSGYAVTFSSAPSGVSIGDKATMVDDGTYFATFTYRVSAISGSTLTFVFIEEDGGFAGDTSPCDLLDMSWNQASATFERFYTSMSGWQADLGNSDVYASSDDAVGECHNDSAWTSSSDFVNISSLGSLSSIKLTVHPSSRHNGAAGSGARFAHNGSSALTPIVLGCNNLTVEWLEVDCTNATAIPTAVNIGSNALTNVYVRNMLIHDLDPGDSAGDRTGILVTGTSSTVSRNVLNNFIYNIKCTISSPAEDKDCLGIGQINPTTSEKGANYFNNTVRGISTTRGTDYGYWVSIVEQLTNNIALDCGTACYKISNDSSGHASSSHNLSDDLTAGGLGLVSNQLTAQTSADGVTAALTVVSATNLHLRGGSTASNPSSHAIDRGTPLSGPDGILTDIDGDTRVYGIPNALHTGYWDIGADESVYSHPYPATVDAAGYHNALNFLSPATADAATVDPTITGDGVDVTPSASTADAASVSPTTVLGSFSVTPSAATADTGTALGSVNISVPPITPNAATAKASGVDPEVSPSAGVITSNAVTVDPTVQFSGISVTPSAATAKADVADVSDDLADIAISVAAITAETGGVNPTAILGGYTELPTEVTATASTITLPDIALSGFSVTAKTNVNELSLSSGINLNSITVTPSAATAEVSCSVGDVEHYITPVAVTAETSATNPTLIFGSVTVTPSAATSDASTPTTFVLGISSFTATADSGTSGPVIDIAIPISVVATADTGTAGPLRPLVLSPASVDTSSSVGSVILGGYAITPSVLSSKPTVLGPTLTLSSFSLAPSEATGEASTPSPIIEINTIVAPAPARAKIDVYNPQLTPARITVVAQAVLSGLRSDLVKISKVPSFSVPSITNERFDVTSIQTESFIDSDGSTESFSGSTVALETFTQPKITSESIE